MFKVGDKVIATEDYMDNNTKDKVGVIIEVYDDSRHPYSVEFNERLDFGNDTDRDWNLPGGLLKLVIDNEPEY